MRESLHTVASFCMSLMTHPWEQLLVRQTYIQRLRLLLSIDTCAWPIFPPPFYLTTRDLQSKMYVEEKWTLPFLPLVCALEITRWCILLNRLWHIPKTSTGAQVKFLTRTFAFFLRQAPVMCWQISMACGWKSGACSIKCEKSTVFDKKKKWFMKK